MYRFDKRIVYVFLAIAVVSMLVRRITDLASIESLLLSIPAVLVAITFHEYAHAFAAYKLGDDTAKMQGRLSLNPFKHMDPIGSVMLLFLGIGWGKPVQVNPRNYNRNISITKADAIISAAGPIMNFLLAVIFAIITCIVAKANNSYLIFSSEYVSTLGIGMITTSNIVRIIIKLLLTIVSVNIGLGIFNLIPLPPLDGSKVLNHFLPYNARSWFQNNEQLFYIIFLIIWFTGIAGTIISPAILGLLKILLKGIASIFGVGI